MDLYYKDKDNLQKNTNLYDETTYNNDIKSRIVNKLKSCISKKTELIKTNNLKN